MKKIYLIFFTVILGAMVVPKAQAQCPNDIILDSDETLCSKFINFNSSKWDGDETFTFSGATEGVSSNPQGTFNVGVTLVEIYEPDSSTTEDPWCTFNITIEDNEYPVLTYNPDTTIYLDEFGKASLANTNWFEGATDNCGVYAVKFMDYSLPDSSSAKFVNTLHFECEVFTDSVIYLSVDDVNGNFYTFDSLFRLSVLDTIAPTTKFVGDTTISLDEFGKASIIQTDLITSLTDNCTDSLYIIDDYSSLGTTNYSCADLGENTLTLEVQDEFGNLSTCEVTVNITKGDYLGGADPTCKLTTNAAPYILYLDEYGGAELIADSLNVNSTDACGNSDNLTFEFVNAEFSDSWSCEDIDKTYALDVRVTDIYDNSTTCTAYVQVKDISPEAVCQPVTVYLDENGSATITDASLVDYGSTDNCGIDTMYLTSNVFDCNDIGLAASPTVALTVEDVNGNSSTCWAEVTVLDTIKPIVPNYSITVENDPGLNCATIEFPDLKQELLASGEEGITLPNAPPSQGGVAYNPIKKLYYAVRAGDPNFTIYTYDETGSQLAANTAGFDFRGLWWNPNVSGLEGSSYGYISSDSSYYVGDGYRNVDLDANGFALSTGTNDPTSNYQPANQSQADYDYMADEVIYYYNKRIYRTSRSSGDSLGTYSIRGLPATTLNWTFIGFTGITGAEILVYDYSNKEVYFFDKSTGAYSHSVQLPASAPSPTSLNTSYANGYIWISDGSVWRSYKVTGEEAGISDNCGIASIEYSHSEENCFPIGRTEVTMTITDASGNTSHGSMFVNVNDTENSFAIAQDVTIQLDKNGNASVTTAEVDNGSNTASGIASMELSKTDFTCDDVGANDVVLTVTDNNGNISTATAVVTVEDNVAPVAVAQNVTIELDNAGNGSTTVTEVDNGSNDACGIATFELTQTDFDCSHVGTNDVILTVTDNNGNISTATAIITVEDNVAPVAIAQNVTAVLDDAGKGSVTVAEVDNGSNDACGIASLALSQTDFDFSHVGTNEVTLTVTDNNGNESTATAVVTVEDNDAPVAVVQNVTVELDDAGKGSVTVAEVDNGSNAASGIASMELSKTDFTCDDVGVNDVVLTVTDNNGNESTATAVVTVHDTISPNIEAVADIELEVDPGICETEIEYPAIDATDNCNTTLLQTEGLGNDGLFPLGTTTETWVAADAAGNSDTVSFRVTITADNDAPTLSPIDDITVEENAGLIYVPLSGISYGIDCVEEDVMLSSEVTSGMGLVALDSVMYTAGADSGKLMLSITPEMSGDAEVMVTVVDEAGDTATASFMVTVTPVNYAPSLVNPIADQTVNASYELAIAMSDALGEYFDDPDGDMLTLTAMLEDGSVLPVWAEVVGDTLYAVPMIADTGCYNVVVEASDGELTATDTFRVCVEGYPTSIDDIEAGKFEVTLYPNPTQGMVNADIELSTARNIELTVLDITGKQVLRKQFSAAERITFDMSGKVSGMYFVKLDFEEQQVVKKLIVDRK